MKKTTDNKTWTIKFRTQHFMSNSFDSRTSRSKVGEDNFWMTVTVSKSSNITCREIWASEAFRSWKKFRKVRISLLTTNFAYFSFYFYLFMVFKCCNILFLSSKYRTAVQQKLIYYGQKKSIFLILSLISLSLLSLFNNIASSAYYLVEIIFNLD